MVNRVLRAFMRAVQTNDIDGYISILPAIIDIYFGLNRPNYARWGVLFLNQLAKASSEIKAIFKAGVFSNKAY